MPANDGSNGNATNGHATEQFPPNAMTEAVSKWTTAVPKNHHVYGEKMLDCSDGALSSQLILEARVCDTSIQSEQIQRIRECCCGLTQINKTCIPLACT